MINQRTINSIGILKKYHSEIIGQILKVKPWLKKEKFEEDIIIYSSEIFNLMGKIAVHFTIKSTVFYPSLFQQNDEKIKLVAQKLGQEMELMKSIFQDYRAKWKKIGSIKENIPNFIEESRDCFKKLTDYFKKEEYELFSLIESLF